MSDLDLDKLKAIAEAASPVWESEERDPTEIRIRVSGGEVHGYTCFVSTRWVHPSQNDEQRANAAHIVAFQPSAVLSLIKRVESAEAQYISTPQDEEGKPPIGDISYARQWARDTLSGTEDGRRFAWGQRNLARAFLNTEATLAGTLNSMVSMSEENVRLRALLTEAGEALAPFAQEADQWLETVPDEHRSLCTEPGSETALFGSETAFTMGDLRAARTVATKIEDALK